MSNEDMDTVVLTLAGVALLVAVIGFIHSTFEYNKLGTEIRDLQTEVGNLPTK